MLETVIVMLTAGFIAVGVVNEVVLPVGEYTIEKGTEAYEAGKELIIGTEAD